MCGYDLRIQPKRRQRVSWIDALLVLAVLVVLIFWWQLGSQPSQRANGDSASAVILPTNIPLLVPTLLPTLTPEPTATVAPISPEDVFVTHEVQSGETLLAIAGIYGVTVEEIQRVNNMSDELIRIGEKLIIPIARENASVNPAPVTTEFRYTVQAGDTIISIATLFGSTVEDILRANDLTEDDLIRPGDVLAVPVREVPQEVLETASGNGAQGNTGESINSSDLSTDDTIYIEPRLTGPPNRANLPRDDSVLLRWISVDVLARDEWYVLMLYPVEGAAQTLPSIWTKGTSYRLGTEYAPPEGETATYTWMVSVVRVIGGGAGQPELKAASPPSAIRTFTWE